MSDVKSSNQQNYKEPITNGNFNVGSELMTYTIYNSLATVIKDREARLMYDSGIHANRYKTAAKKFATDKARSCINDLTSHVLIFWSDYKIPPYTAR